MKLVLPNFSLILLIGVAGSGKSTFARKRFQSTEIVSSDACRAVVCDDETNQEATKDAFELVQFIARKRLAHGRLTAIDATNVREQARRPLLWLAEEYRCPVVAIVFNTPQELCVARRRATGPEQNFWPDVIAEQTKQLQHSLATLHDEDFSYIYTISGSDEAEEVIIERISSD